MIKGLAAVAAAALIATVLSAPSDARTKHKKHYVVQPSWDWRTRTPWLDGHVATPSLDGYVTGRGRTCGYPTFQYDNLGVPYGPYCH
jgi:hypothetical protein